MINGIGLSTGGSIGIGTQTPTQRSDAASAATQAKLPAASLEDQGAVSTTISQMTAWGPPVDVDRIASLRSAIKTGQYSIDPDAIAQKMMSTDLVSSNTGASL